MQKRIKIFFIFLTALFLFLIDIFLKKSFLKNPDFLSLPTKWENIINFTFYKNYGIIAGWPFPRTLFYLVFIIVILFLIWLAQKNYQKNSLDKLFFVVLILTGAFSNFYDRFFYGYVVDFINIPWFSVFNLADIYITFGSLLLIRKIWLKPLF